MISFPKDKINVLLLENVHQDAYDLFKNDGFNVRLLPAAFSENELLNEIENVGHNMHHDRPDQLERLLNEFYKKHGFIS
ncbi:hypothetical protein CH375_21615 [Leptospira ellisii]|nr:hypothetical protein CH375_21615 [Leptospira ellisii]